MQSIKKYIAELIGIFVLVLFACGTAVNFARSFAPPFSLAVFLLLLFTNSLQAIRLNIFYIFRNSLKSEIYFFAAVPSLLSAKIRSRGSVPENRQITKLSSSK